MVCLSMGNLLRLEFLSTLLTSSRLSEFYSSLLGTRSCVVLLANTEPICDGADWITQYLPETILEIKEVHEFVALATENVKAQKRIRGFGERTSGRDRTESIQELSWPVLLCRC